MNEKPNSRQLLKPEIRDAIIFFIVNNLFLILFTLLNTKLSHREYGQENFIENLLINFLFMNFQFGLITQPLFLVIFSNFNQRKSLNYLFKVEGYFYAAKILTFLIFFTLLTFLGRNFLLQDNYALSLLILSLFLISIPDLPSLIICYYVPRLRVTEERVIYSILTAIIIILAVYTLDFLNKFFISDKFFVLLLSGCWGFLLTYILYQNSPEDSRRDTIIKNLLIISATIMMSCTVAMFLIVLYLGFVQSGH